MSEPFKDSKLNETEKRPGGASAQTELVNNDPPTVVKFSNNPVSASSDKTVSGSNSKEGSAASRFGDMPATGTKVGNYELGLPIGIGGMATVYAAQDVALERTVALKILPPKSAQENEVLQRFLLEGKAAAQLDHPNIARIHALGHDGSYYFLAFEYVEGRTVRQWIDEQGKIPVEKVVDWSCQVADALSHADRRGVVHRDIKPSNLIVTPSGQVKLVDLGLARRHELQGHVDLTQSGVTLGTFDYISPEQARDPRNVDIRSDLYSLGCTMFHMLAGVPPFPGANVVQKLLQHQEQQPPDLMAFNPNVPQVLADFIRRMMAKAPADRPASADLCVKELRSISESLKPEPPPLFPDVEPNSIRGLMLWGIPALALTLLVTFGAWWLGDRNKPLEAKTDANAFVGITEGAGTSEQSPEVIKPKSLDALPKSRQNAPGAVRVSDGAGLVQALKSAVPGSVVILTGAGPYPVDQETIGTISNGDLTIRAERGASPVLVASSKIVPNERPGCLLGFKNSRILLQGLVFDLRGDAGSKLQAAIMAEECDLALRDVTFFSDQVEGDDYAAFVRLQKNEDVEDKADWRPARLENCRFLGPRIAVYAKGPLDVTLADSAHLSSEPLICVDSGERDRIWPCLVQLDHVNVMATGWTPIFELNNSPARIRVQNSIFAPRPGGQISLVSSRWPSRVDWFGRGNVYGEVTTYLESSRFDEEVLNFDAWSHSGSITREQNSLATMQSVYSPVDSSLLAMQGRWNEAFALNRGPWANQPAGVRSWAEANQPEVVAYQPKQQRDTKTKVTAPPEFATNSTNKPVEGGNAASGGTEPTKAVSGERTELANTNAEEKVQTVFPMSGDVRSPAQKNENRPNGETRGLEQANESSRRDQPGAVAERSTDTNTGLTGQNNRVEKPAEGPVVLNTDERANPDVTIVSDLKDVAGLKKTLEANAKSGAVISLASGSRVELTETVQLKSGRWQIGAERGAVRPRLIFQSRNQALVEGNARWGLEPGVLVRFRGLDIEWDANEPTQERLFELASGSQVIFEDCTLTLKGNRSDLVLFSLNDKDPAKLGELAGQRGIVRLLESVVRTPGGLFRVSSNVQSELQLNDTLVVAGRSLLNLLAPEPRQSSQSTRLEMNQTTAILGTSLATIFQGKAPAEPPHLECHVRRTILAADPAKDSPLIEVRDGDPNKIEVECLSWNGEEVGYHQWLTYRLDQNDIVGMLARRQNREEWQLAHADDDLQSVHGDLGFMRDFRAESKPIWEMTPSEFAMSPNSSGRSLGVRQDRLPAISLTNLRKPDSN